MKDYQTVFANVCSPSAHRRAKVATLPPHRHGTESAASAQRSPSKPLRPDAPLSHSRHVTFRFLGGSEALIRLDHANGRLVLPGHVCLVDALMRLSGRS